MHYVSAEGLTKSYGIKPLFEDHAFHISEGDKIALVARNGSGKTTLLKIIAGLDVPDEGKVWINKNVDTALFEQDPQLVEGKTVLDNIFHISHPTMQAICDYESAVDSGNESQINAALVKMDELNA